MMKLSVKKTKCSGLLVRTCFDLNNYLIMGLKSYRDLREMAPSPLVREPVRPQLFKRWIALFDG